ncbi:hypothetical protein D9619_002638 [Psilocybe cf. subviscida]|uniref:Protein CPL1-like domain-containing protein n=1 Tax=Psilocybe cf. subviscida TaxID=2480587 RepID=A0A8H5EUA7_9AGAR|nr:hypothetical protein D9619_002638 [Psilocybe cf. subviscida]
MTVFARSLIGLTLALSVFAVSVTEPDAVTATRVARGGGGNNGNSGGGPYGPGGGSNNGGHDGPGGPHGPGSGNGGGNHGGGGGGKPHHPEPSHRPPPRPYRRALDTLHGAQIADEICPGDAYGCPIAPAGSLSSLPNGLDDWVNQGFYCVDRTADLTDCGGCAALDAKHDCTRITGAKSVSCVSGSCVVDSCLPNFTLDSNSCTAN